MAARAEQQQLTAALLDALEKTAFPSALQLDRIERLISTRDELEDYVAILTQKVHGKIAPDAKMLDRLERLLRVLQRLDQEES